MEPSHDLGEEGEVSAPVWRQSLKSVLNAVFFLNWNDFFKVFFI